MDHANRVPASKGFHCQGVKVIPCWRTSPCTSSPSHSGHSPQCPAPSGTTEAAWITDNCNIKRLLHQQGGHHCQVRGQLAPSLAQPAKLSKKAYPRHDCACLSAPCQSHRRLRGHPGQDVPHTPAPCHWTLSNLRSVLLISGCSSV